MSAFQITVLGAIAGGTIFFGLPVARMRTPSKRLRAFLNATATGILLFLLWDVLTHAMDPINTALTSAAIDHKGSWLRFAGLAATMAATLAVGLLSLVYYDRWMAVRGSRAHGPGAMAAGELRVTRAGRFSLALSSPARRLAFMIAVGIGMHNFSEGLAIGQSAARGDISLAVLLIVGFGLHNATEGFGITAPLAAESDRPGWGFLTAMGLIGGGPTFLGTMIGQTFVNDTVYLGFLCLAAGSILYVVVQLLRAAERLGHKELLYWGLLIGLLAGFATDMVVTAGGA